MPLTIMPIYAVPLVLLFLALSARIVLYRRSSSIPLGDGGDAALFARIRAQGNCAEYMPLGLLLLLMAELSGGTAFALHAAGLCLLAGRSIHAAHLSFFPTRYAMRIAAIVLTTVSYMSCLRIALHWQ